MTKIVCPKCGNESYFSLAQTVYQGPFRCGKCRESYSIRIENNELKSCTPINQQDMKDMDTRKGYH